MQRSFTIPQLIADHALERGDAPALVSPDYAGLSYAQLHRSIEQTRAALAQCGIRHGDRIAVVLSDGAQLAFAFLAISSVATCAPLNPNLRRSELEAFFHRMEIAAVVLPAETNSPAWDAALRYAIPIITLSPFASEIGGTFERLHNHEQRKETKSLDFAQPDDIALLLPTSGTTGQPKFVPLTHRNLCQTAYDISAAVGLGPTDRCLNVMPLHYIHGLSTIYASLASGGSIVCLPYFEPSRFFELTEEFRPTWYSAAPTLHQMILDQVALQTNIGIPNSLKFIRSASAPMPPKLKQQIEQIFGVPQIEAYGMTETSPQIASNRIEPNGRRFGSVGKAAGPEVAILSDDTMLVSPLSLGEVIVRGPNVMRGYIDDPSANETAFWNGWFRTGDQGYLDEDGFLFITGRIKEIINRGGEKISPREVDEVLLSHPAVSQAITFPVAHTALGEDIAAAIVLNSGAMATPNELRRFAEERLSDYKVPRNVLIVDTLPTGENGKLSRLTMAERLGLVSQEEIISPPSAFVAARTPTEEQLSEIWRTLLRVSEVSIESSFGELGGNSLLATRALSRIQEAMNVRLSLIDFYETPTIAGLAQKIDASVPSAASSQILPRAANSEIPISPSQHGLWFLDQLYPGNGAYNMHRALRFRGRLDKHALQQSLTEVVGRHEALRTRFPSEDGNPRAVLASSDQLVIESIDLRRFSGATRELAVRKLAVQEAAKPIDLSSGPMLRSKLLQIDDDDYVLLLTTHHNAADGWSFQLILDELASSYNAHIADKPSLLPTCHQFPDFVLWQQERLESEHQENLLGYWEKQLAGMPMEMVLPFDRPRPARPTFRGAKHYFTIARQTRDAMIALVLQEDATEFMGMLAAFCVLLARYAGQTDIIVGSPFASRMTLESESIIGFLNNTLLLRVTQPGDLSFRQLIGQVREMVIGASAHQDMPFETLVRALQPTRTAQRMALFQVNFRLQSIQMPLPEFSGLSTELFSVDNGYAKFDLACELTASEHGLNGFIEYSTDLFDLDTARRIAQDYQELLSIIILDPDVKLQQLHQAS